MQTRLQVRLASGSKYLASIPAGDGETKGMVVMVVMIAAGDRVTA